MAGDWIKMRTNLWDDPRVSAIVDATDATEAAVIGGLYWLWATADQHTEDGCMPGLTLRQIDRKTGVPGLAAALVAVGWLKDDPQGVVLAEFTEHNGTSAKRRANDAKSKASSRNVSASHADKTPTPSGQSATDCGAREREEEEKRDTSSLRSDGASATAGEICKAMRETGLAGVSPSHPKLINLIAAGMTKAELVDAAAEAVKRQKPFAYALSTAEGRRRDAAVENLPSAEKQQDPDSQPAVEAEGVRLGLGKWSQVEQWPAYFARVRTAQQAEGGSRGGLH